MTPATAVLPATASTWRTNQETSIATITHGGPAPATARSSTAPPTWRSASTVTEKAIGEDPVDETPIVLVVFRAAASAPVVFYLVEVPDWCWVHIAATDGAQDPRLGSTGPLPSNDHHGECLAGTSLPDTTVAS